MNKQTSILASQPEKKRLE